jgi:ATPase subunit of ABC transporter with duplicated ATPase domains
VRTLSGGERNRLLLARLFALPANVLVLDEPTNDLDIDTLELLEDLLQNYDGTVFLVSHDRRFPGQRGHQHHCGRRRRLRRFEPVWKAPSAYRAAVWSEFATK